MAKRKPFIGRDRKETMRRRAEAAAAREHGPLVQAAQGGVRQANREFRREKQSVKGADAVLQRSMNRQLKGAHQSHLRGRYKQETLAELRSIKAGSKAAVPGLLADAAAARSDAIADARASVAEARAKQDVTAAKKYNKQLDRAVSKKAAAVKEKREKAGEPKLNKNALIAARTVMHDWQQNRPIKDKNGETVGYPQEMNPLKTDEDWRRAAANLTKQFKGFSIEEAQKAMAILRARREKARKPAKTVNKLFR